MADKNPGLDQLFERLVTKQLSEADLNLLLGYLGSDDPDPRLAELVMAHLQQTPAEELSPEVIARLESRLPLILASKPAGIFSIIKKRWVRYAAAVILLLGTGFYFLANNKQQANEQPALVNTAPVDIDPGKQGAILTLEDGSMMVLDSLGNGVVAMQNGTRVILENGELVYETADDGEVKVGYNTMSTPKGRQFQLSLPDGSKVWLNAASSIRYPTVFTGSERKVEVTGEAYFEVVKNTGSPFKVKINEETEIEVLGTHFNVNSYNNEESINTTLLEGSVRVKNKTGDMVLTPGQQARIAGTENIKLYANVDLEKVMAWKNGVFNFQDATLQEVMRQLERWYDIDVTYEKNVPRLEFYGKMGKDLSLATVLRGLEKSNVHFRIEEGRRLVVMP